MFDSIEIISIGSVSQTPVVSLGTCELDSHADNMCTGSKCKVESTTGQTVRVKPFSDDLREIEEVSIGSVITAYVHPSSGESFILKFNDALIFGDRLNSSLVNHN